MDEKTREHLGELFIGTRSNRASGHDTPYGRVGTITLTNRSGASVTLSTLGAAILNVKVPDRNGNLVDVALGYKHIQDYMNDGACCGKIPGRYANRIAGGRFSLDGKEYQLSINNGPNALHGGPTGFQNHIWLPGDTGSIGSKVTFVHESPDGDEGYPGNLKVTAQYEWTDDNRLLLRLSAETDAPTIINLTSHTYWNLNGEGNGNILDHFMQLNASRYLPTDETLVPTGEIATVEGTPMDFRKPRVIGERIKELFPALINGKGYDSCWPIDNYRMGRLSTAAILYSPQTGIKLRVRTSQPAVQVYTGNWLDGSPESKSGRPYRDYDGVAIECQDYPDAPNHPNFHSTVLTPDKKYSRSIYFEFTVEDTEN